MEYRSSTSSSEGVLLINKPKGKTSFSLVSRLRKCLGVKKIGHAGTLDPFASGVMVMLIGRNYTKKSEQFLVKDKEYLATLFLGAATETYDPEGKITATSPIIPSLEDVLTTLSSFEGIIEQTPPMFSAKKYQGKKLYDFARKGIDIQRSSIKVEVRIKLISYNYPHMVLQVFASKGTYIRSLAHDIGLSLKCFAHLIELTRIRSGTFSLEECLDGNMLYQNIEKHIVEHRLLKTC